MVRVFLIAGLMALPLAAQAGDKKACMKQTEMVQSVVDARKDGQNQNDAVASVLGEMKNPKPAMRTAVMQAAAWVYSVDASQLDAVPASYQAACEAQ